MHFFVWREDPDEQALRACVAEMTKIVDAASDELTGETGKGPPMSAPAAVSFNGRGDQGAMPFHFPGQTPTQFGDDYMRYAEHLAALNACDTQFLPYDAVVVACLLVARDHFPPEVLEIGSDGKWDQGDLQAGADLYERVLGRPAQNPISTQRHPSSPEFWDDVTEGSPRSWLRLVVVLAVGAAVIWMLTRSQCDFVIRNDRQGLTFDDGVSAFEREQIADFVRRAGLSEQRLRITGRRRDNSGRLVLTIRGRLSPGDRQRLRNFLISLL